MNSAGRQQSQQFHCCSTSQCCASEHSHHLHPYQLPASPVSSSNRRPDKLISSPSSLSSSSSFSSSHLAMTYSVLLLFLLCSTLSSGRLLNHRHRLQQEATEEGKEAEDISLLEGKLQLKLSAQRVTSEAVGEKVCAKTSDRSATLLQSMSKTTGQPVLLDGQQKFKVTFCGEEQLSASVDDDSERCAVGSNCATIYRWAEALIHPAHIPHFDPSIGLTDEVLIPVDCLCVLSWAKTFRGQGPIILE